MPLQQIFKVIEHVIALAIKAVIKLEEVVKMGFEALDKGMPGLWIFFNRKSQFIFQAGQETCQRAAGFTMEV
jgi:hypothetical protein